MGRDGSGDEKTEKQIDSKAALALSRFGAIMDSLPHATQFEGTVLKHPIQFSIRTEM